MSTSTPQQPALGAPSPRQPSIHARAVITWLAIFPLVTLGFYAIEPFASGWNPVLRALVLSLVVVPVAVYLVVPQLMRVYALLQRSRATRHNASSLARG